MTQVEITVLENSDNGASFFGKALYHLDDFGGMMISPRQEALNFRHRASAPGYASDWHVAGDPTLIVIRQGVLRLILRDGEWRDFGPGEQFIAKDFLEEGVVFDDSLHGHRAEVLGDETLLALHVKLGVLK